MALTGLHIGSAAVARSRRRSVARFGILAVGLTCGVISMGLHAAPPADAFTVGAGAVARTPRGGRVRLQAEAEAPAPAPAPGTSTALVKVTEENAMTTASVLGGLVGFLLGGVWVGGALFAASAYLTRKDDNDLSKALKGIATGSLEALNFSAYLNTKYEVSDKVGTAVSGAIDNAKTKTGTEDKGPVNNITGVVDNVVKAVESVDKDVGIKDTLGNLATSASDVAFQAVDKAVSLNEEYKIADKVGEKLSEAINKASAATKK